MLGKKTKEIREIRNIDTKIVTDIELQMYINSYNKNHATKVKINKINSAEYNVIEIHIPELGDSGFVKQITDVEPMTNLETYYFVKGFYYLKDNPSN